MVGRECKGETSVEPAKGDGTGPRVGVGGGERDGVDGVSGISMRTSLAVSCGGEGSVTIGLGECDALLMLN